MVHAVCLYAGARDSRRRFSSAYCRAESKGQQRTWHRADPSSSASRRLTIRPFVDSDTEMISASQAEETINRGWTVGTVSLLSVRERPGSPSRQRVASGNDSLSVHHVSPMSITPILPSSSSFGSSSALTPASSTASASSMIASSDSDSAPMNVPKCIPVRKDRKSTLRSCRMRRLAYRYCSGCGRRGECRPRQQGSRARRLRYSRGVAAI